MRGGVHLAGADNLMIGGFQIEIEFAIACRFFLIAFFLRAVATHRRDALFRRGFWGIQLAGEDSLTIARF